MGVPSLPSEVEAAPQDHEQQWVHDVYNEIAPHFSLTRYKPWPIVEKFLTEQPSYSIGLDVGCGNGKYLGVNKNLYMIGSDRSLGLIECAHGNGGNNYTLCVADGLSLPHENGRFDFAISIAVIHHFSTETRRIDAIRHILSKLRVGGRFLVYCWALEQEKSRRGYKEGDAQDVLVPWVLQKRVEKKKAEKSNEGENEPEMEKSAKSEKPKIEQETKYRYYHLYKEGELIENSEKAGAKVIEHGYERDNWWVIMEKI